jgi:ubiquinone/menaquinone biosynthesis C-methylase UbiE
MAGTVGDRNKAAAKHFQDTAESWTDRYREDHGLSHGFLIRRQAVEWQLVRIAGHRHERALDLGCGTGPYLPLLARLARDVVGADIAPGMIKEAKRNLSPAIHNVRLVVASVFDLPFPDAHFDIGVCVGVLEYFDDPAAVLRAAFRVMKSGGSMVFTAPNVYGIARITGFPRTLTLLVPPSWKVTVGGIFDHVRGRQPDPSRYYLGASFTMSRMRRLCEDAGLELTELTTSGYDGLRVAGIPVPARFGSIVDRLGESNRHHFPWKHRGNNLIVTIRKPTVSSTH